MLLPSKNMASKPNQQKFSEARQVLSEMISIGMFNINACNKQRRTPLHLAVKKQKYVLVESLLQNGANVNARDRKGWTPLGIAIKNSLPDMVKILCNHQADLSDVSDSQSALGLAITVVFKPYREHCYNIKQRAVLDLILQYGMKSKNNLLIDYYKLCKAIVNNDTRATKRLVNRCNDVNYTDLDYERPLGLAVYLGRFEIVELLLEKDYDYLGRELLLVLAIDNNHLEIVNLLLKLNTNVNFFSIFYLSPYEETPLYHATKRYNIKLMRLLLDYGAEVHGWIKYKDESRDTALHAACGNYFLEGVELLLENGAEVNMKNREGETPLHIACSEIYNDIELFEVLVTHGADVAALDNRDWTILHHIDSDAELYVVKHIISLALDKGVNINAKRNDGYTVLQSTSCTHFLEYLKNGADLNIQSNEGTYLEHECYDEDDDEDFEFQCSAFEYVKRLQYLGYKVEHPLFCQNHSGDDLTEFYQLELYKLRNSVIAWNPRTTLYDVLFMSRGTLDRFSSNKNLKEAYDKCDNDFVTIYPYFGNVLNVLYRREMNRKIFLDAAKNNLCKIFGNRIPDLCTHMILKNVEDNCLKKFM